MIKVASYNIRKSVGLDWKRQPSRILDILAELDADIIALQEVDRRFGSERASSIGEDDILNRSRYNPVRFNIRPMSLGWHGNAILVRKGITVLDSQRIELPGIEPRGAVMADLDVEGTAVRIVGMHLGLFGPNRRQQARAVLNYLERREGRHPTVIMGDLNQWNADGGCLTDFAGDHNVLAPGPSFHSSRPMLALDRIITSRDFSVEAMGVHHSALAARGSDHLPIWAKLSLVTQDAKAPETVSAA
jgi:endonuclease/exonuclease/phosphatase family metal-dependent hydrolase